VDKFLSDGVSPEDILFTTFSKSGAEEAKQRAVKRFNLHPEQLPWFRTLHSIAYQSIPKTSGVMNNADWCSIAKLIGIPFTLKVATGEGLQSGATKGDAMLMLYGIERVTGQNMSEVWKRRDEWCGAFPGLTDVEYQHFRKVLIDYKESNGRIDFTDMLHRFLDNGIAAPSVTHVIVDEAQDLSYIQWMVAQKIWERAKEVVVAGDDDQAIHEWNGAAPSMLINLPCHTSEVLGQSYRVPSAIHRLATGISTRIKVRTEKKYAPRDHTGQIIWTSSLDKIPLKETGTWLLLARNQYCLRFLEAWCMRMGVLFSNGREDKKLIDAVMAIKAWITLTENAGTINHYQALALYSCMSQRDRVERGAKTKLESSKETTFTFARLHQHYGLLARSTLDWQVALDQIPPHYLAYLKQAISTDEKVRVEISTIHGAKGREADNVVLLLDMTQRTYEAFHRNPDAEHRVWYVGVTRAKDRLFLVNPDTTNQYPMPS
jgi:DNA helicase-2/ATP-dependent DNA helicase PcrA